MLQKYHICGSIVHFAGRGGTGCHVSYENLQSMYKDANIKCDIDRYRSRRSFHNGK